MKKATLALLTCFCFGPLNAADTIRLTKLHFEIQSGSDIIPAINEAIDNPESILRSFTPNGLRYRQKLVTENSIEFVATKRVLMVSRTVFFRANLFIAPLGGTPECEFSYAIELDFKESGDLIVDNTQSVAINLCLNEKGGPTHATLSAQPVVTKGNDYNFLFGPIIVNVANDQVPAIIRAIEENTPLTFVRII